MSDLEQLYAAMARQAGLVVLPPPETVRRRGDRRAGMRLVAVAATVAVAVAAITTATQWGLAGGNPSGPQTSPTAVSTLSPAPGPTASSSDAAPVTSAPAPPEPPRATSPVASPIPDKAFLQQADTNGDAPIHEANPDRIGPSLCGTTYPSDSSIRARRSREYIFWNERSTPTRVPDGGFTETITGYRPGGGSAFMNELRAAVAACPTETIRGWAYSNRLVDTPARGDESIMIDVSRPVRDNHDNLTGGTDHSYVSVVRIDNVVMVLFIGGWERGWFVDPAVVDRLTATGVSRLQAWLG